MNLHKSQKKFHAASKALLPIPAPTMPCVAKSNYCLPQRSDSRKLSHVNLRSVPRCLEQREPVNEYNPYILMHQQDRESHYQKRVCLENWSSTWNSTVNSCSRWTPKFNKCHCLGPIKVPAFLAVSKISEEADKSSHFLKSSTEVNLWNKENSHKVTACCDF